MGDRNISEISAAAAELTLGQGHTLTMASHQDELLGKILEIEKTLDKIPEMEKTLGQLLDWLKSVKQELRSLRPGPPITTRPLPSTVIENYNPKQEVYDLYPRLPEASMNQPKREEITTRKLEIEAMQNEEDTDLPISYY